MEKLIHTLNLSKKIIDYLQTSEEQVFITMTDEKYSLPIGKKIWINKGENIKEF